MKTLTPAEEMATLPSVYDFSFYDHQKKKHLIEVKVKADGRHFLIFDGAIFDWRYELIEAKSWARAFAAGYCEGELRGWVRGLNNER